MLKRKKTQVFGGGGVVWKDNISSSNKFFQTEPFVNTVHNVAATRLVGHGVKEVMGCERPLFTNKHIRFSYDESEPSVFSDSIEDFEGDGQRILKLRQRSRKKKKASPFAKKQLRVASDVHFDGSPKSWKREKHRYQVRSAYRRTVSHPLGGDEEWSSDDGIVRGKGGFW